MTIQHKRILDAGRLPLPTQIEEGELCINFPDRAIFSRDDSGNIIKLGGDGSGGDGLPNGGTTGQHLSKVSNADGDADWTDVPQELPDGGTIGQTLVKSSGDDGDVEWSDAPNDLPVGGGAGQVLTKVDNDDYNVAWTNPSGGSSMPDFIVKNVDFTADKENGYLCSVGGGRITVTLPTASDSDWLVIGDFDGKCSVLNPIVITSPQNIHSVSDDLVITSSNTVLWLQYINANDSEGNVVGWKIVDGIGVDGIGVLPVTTLWTGNTGSGTIILSEAIENFDMIIIEGYHTESNGTLDIGWSDTVTPQQLVANTYNVHSINFSSSTVSTDFSRVFTSGWGGTGVVLDFNSEGGETVVYRHIKGIKY